MLAEGFGGSLPPQRFAGATVERGDDGVQLVLGVSAQVGSLGEVLA
jgi:hypothetical protein